MSASAHRYQATWRDIIFNRVYDDTGITDDPTHLVAAFANSDFRLDSLDATRVETQDYRELRQFLEGAEPNEAYEGAMLLIGSGIILGATVADLEDKTALMRSQFAARNVRIAADAASPPGVLPFDFKRATAAGAGVLALRAYCRPASGRPVIIGRMREGLSRRFRWTLAAFDAVFHSQTAQSQVATLNGTSVIVNGGDTYALPTITIVTGGSGTFALTLNGLAVFAFTGLASGTWTLDCARSTFTKADGTNGMQYRSSGFLSNIRLLPGGNTFALVSTNLTSVTVGWRDAYS